LEGAEQFSTITLQQGIDLLRQDVAVREAIIHRLISVPLQLHQFDALVSLVFNIGEGRLGDSTLRRLLNAGDTAGAAEQFLVWNKGRVNGQLVEIPGLTRRRRAEKAIFLGQGYPPIAHAEARSITRQAQAGTHSFYAGAYAEEEGEVEGFSLSDYYAAFTDSPQQIANRIMQLIANHPGKFRFMNHIDNQLRELAQGGVIHYQYNRGTRQSPVYDQVQGTPDASLLQTIYNIMDASKAQGCTLMSLMRGAPGNPHAGKAVDISSIQGVTLNDATSPQVLNAVLVAILNLAPGRYKLGLPRTQPADASRSLFIGYEWNETFPIPGNANQSVRADLLTGMGVSQEQITARRQATIQRMNTLAGQQGIRDYNSWQYQILAVENQQARQQLTQALQTASSRGVTIAGLFADGRDHLHIGTNV
jgi:GH24 family phage-related lysozyme (muramidase)